MKSIKIPHLYQLGIRLPIQVLLLSIFVTIVAFMGARKLRIENDLASLLPKNNSDIQNLHFLKNDFGGTGSLVITVESPDPKLAEKFADFFVSDLEKDPFVLYVDYRHPVNFFEKKQWLYVDSNDLREIEKRIDQAVTLEKKGVSGTFKGLMDFADHQNIADLDFNDILSKYAQKGGFAFKKLTSGDQGRLLILRVTSNVDSVNIDACRNFISHIRALEKKTRTDHPDINVSIGYTGDYETPVEQIDYIQREIGIISLIVTALLLLILLLYFRRWSSVILIGLPLTLSIVWTGGLVYLVLGHLNIITGFAAAILAGLGSDYGIFLLTRYYHEIEAGRDFKTACELAFANTGRATYASMITTVGAFIALFFSDFGLFVEFGVVGATGLITSYIAMMLLVPSLLALTQKMKPMTRSFRFRDKFNFSKTPITSTRLFNFVFTPNRALFGTAIAILMTALAALSIQVQSKIEFEDGQMKSDRIESYRLYKKVDRVLNASLNPTILVTNSFDAQKKLVSSLETLLKKDPSVVYNNVVGLSSFIPEKQAEKKVILSRIEQKYQKLHLVEKTKKEYFMKSFKDSLTAAPVTQASLPIEVTRMFTSSQSTDKYPVYLFPSFTRDSSESMKKYQEGIARLTRMDNLDFYAVDSTFIGSDILKLIDKEAPKGLSLIILFFTGVLLFMIRPPHQALVLLAHLIGSLVLLSGVLWLVHLHLNIMNIAVIPIILGTGLDCFIHLYHRHLENKDVSLVLKSEIPAMFISSLTSIVGFGGLVLVTSPGISSVGWVSVLGLTIVTLLCAFVYPRCLILLSKNKMPVLNPMMAEKLTGSEEYSTNTQ